MLAHAEMLKLLNWIWNKMMPTRIEKNETMRNVEYESIKINTSQACYLEACYLRQHVSQIKTCWDAHTAAGHSWEAAGHSWDIRSSIETLTPRPNAACIGGATI